MSGIELKNLREEKVDKLLERDLVIQKQSIIK